jgi:hypothetical protein
MTKQTIKKVAIMFAVLFISSFIFYCLTIVTAELFGQTGLSFLLVLLMIVIIFLWSKFSSFITNNQRLVVGPVLFVLCIILIFAFERIP